MEDTPVPSLSLAPAAGEPGMGQAELTDDEYKELLLVLRIVHADVLIEVLHHAEHLAMLKARAELQQSIIDKLEAGRLAR